MVTRQTDSVNQHFRVMGYSSFSIFVDVVDDGQAVRIVADSGDRRDLLARTEIDDEDGAARGSGRSLPGAAGHHGVPAVGGHRDSLRARRAAVGTNERDPRYLALRYLTATLFLAQSHCRIDSH